MIPSNPIPRNGRAVSSTHSARFSIVYLLPFLFFTCEKLIERNPGITPKTAGIIYASDGSYAGNALLYFIEADVIALPGSQIRPDSIRTDSMGRYAVHSLHDGVYNAFGEKDGERFFRACVSVKNGITKHDTLRDTLGPAGSLSVFVKHRYHGDGRSIMGLMPGTGRYCPPVDSTGLFAFTGFARGTYRVRFLSSLPQYADCDTSISFLSGVNDTLWDTLYLEYDGIPPVAGFTASYDNRSNLARLTWSRMDTTLATGYIVYKAESGATPAPLTQSPIADTFHTDGNLALWAAYDYRVAACKNGKNGPLCENKTIRAIFKPQGWYKGQLHCHTACSDGVLPPLQVMRMYREAGYDFVTVSDHNMVTKTDQYGDTGFCTFPNDEFSYGIKHVNAINAVRHFPGSIPDPVRLQDVIDAALSVGAIPQINHPQYSQHGAADIFNSTGAFLMEIVNFRHDDPAHNAALWDSVLSMGKRIFGTAGDDAHNYISDFNKGWIMVKAPDLTIQSILSSIETGNFYASSGPVITGIVTEGRVLGIESVDGITIDFIGKNGKIMASVAASAGSYSLPADEPYVRAQVTNARGKIAYTQAYFPAERKRPHVPQSGERDERTKK